ncbi:DUF1508 domain-containing protein [Variovorax sp. UMC13]|uniref:DUF1508 domain-containing protein n=1 Tax=Variovorax sp. UMC13 TaxID=1862326 RepID=UPI0038700C39
MKYVVIPVRGGRWVWELRDAEGDAVCGSTGNFPTRDAALQAIHAVRSLTQKAKIFDPLGNVLEVGAPDSAAPNTPNATPS